MGHHENEGEDGGQGARGALKTYTLHPTPYTLNLNIDGGQRA